QRNYRAYFKPHASFVPDVHIGLAIWIIEGRIVSTMKFTDMIQRPPFS
ncbi:MAG: hypothetical protein ACI87E_001927, partial [Mariniblastus sp.]